MPDTILATKADLHEMYTRMLPYLGGQADAGFTPVGTIISVMGNHAPANYLICDGTVYNIADYPELANYFYNEFGSKNKFGGNGTTTFAVPNLKGEFLRMTGTNSHANQGNGAAVGTHQDATEFPYLGTFTTGIQGRTRSDGQHNSATNMDSTSGTSLLWINANTPSTGSETGFNRHTARPTNTSVLYCIATKNIYLNPSLDYSTDEKVVGTWIDGKPIYQKTINFGALPNVDGKSVVIGSNLSIDKVISINGQAFNSVDGESIPLPYAHPHNLTYAIMCRVQDLKTTSPCVYVYTKIDYSTYNAYFTIQYTKTTS